MIGAFREWEVVQCRILVEVTANFVNFVEGVDSADMQMIRLDTYDWTVLVVSFGEFFDARYLYGYVVPHGKGTGNSRKPRTWESSRCVLAGGTSVRDVSCTW